ncbi:carbohydrate binding domain-containing protein [Streptomyces sp. NPDC005780]|uniref:carbohydrate binding domain-containing protein n=1 Tax=Streptomyces sp. NPDC005780 TaxID=3364730 RepID=UPI0036BF1953
MSRPLAAAAATSVMALLAAASAAYTASAASGTSGTSGTSATVYYSTKNHSWTTYDLHYQPNGGAWTALPGVTMEGACADWVKATVDLGSATGLQATFNNGSGTWDNNGGRNYALGAGAVTVKDGVVGTGDPCTTDPLATATVYYAADAGWPTANLHYAPTGGAWTTVPGVGMTEACEGWYKKTVDLGSATGLQATFNNGSGTWDNNGGRNYALGTGITTVKNGQTGTTDPCATTPTPDPTPDPTTPPDPDFDPGGPNYATNPGGHVGQAAAVTVDGKASEWTKDMIVAQGVANDDPRIFRGSHEGPVYDLYSLSAAWDDANLYLMWQFTNVTDVTDPAQGYPTSDNGKPYQGDIPQSIALDVDPDRGGEGLLGAGPAGPWDLRTSFARGEVDHIANFSSKPGVGQPALFSLNTAGTFDYEPANVQKFGAAGITYKYADGLTSSEVTGIKATGNAGYVPADLADADLYEDLLAAGHSQAQDTTYEMNIPLEALGIDRATLESQGLGLMLVSTFGQSAIGSLPQDPTVLDTATEPYGPDNSTSHEKDDFDVFRAPFARVGH